MQEVTGSSPVSPTTSPSTLRNDRLTAFIVLRGASTFVLRPVWTESRESLEADTGGSGRCKVDETSGAMPVSQRNSGDATMVVEEQSSGRCPGRAILPWGTRSHLAEPDDSARPGRHHTLALAEVDGKALGDSDKEARDVLRLTPRATEHLVRVRNERGIDDRHAARFVGKGSRIALTFAQSAEPGDRRIETRGIAVLLAPEVADRLDQSVIDARREDGKDVLMMWPISGTKDPAGTKDQRRPKES
jgi:hypothetical protein